MAKALLQKQRKQNQQNKKGVPFMRKLTEKIVVCALAAVMLSAMTVYAQPDTLSLVEDIPTIQSFTQDPVAEEDITRIVNAGINAPSAVNSQPWHFSVITDAEVLQDIARGMGMPAGDSEGDSADSQGESAEEAAPAGGPEGGSEGAPAGESGGGSAPAPGGGGAKAGVADVPLAIVISCRDGSDFDAGLACQNMSVEANLLGYGTKIVSSPTMVLNGARQEEFREMLGIPVDQSVVAVLLVGTSAQEEADVISSATTRNAAEDVVSFIMPE